MQIELYCADCGCRFVAPPDASMAEILDRRIPLQVKDGESGYLVSTVEECAQRTMEIMRDPGLGKELGRKGKEYVRSHFLMPRLLRDWLRIFLQATG